MTNSPSLKVGLVCDDTLDKPDGVQQYVLTLGAQLHKRGHTVHYLTSTTTRTDIVNIHSLSKNVPVRFNSNHGGMPLLAPLKEVQELLAKEHFDVLHIQMPYSPLLAGRIIKVAGSKTAVVGTFHIFPESKLVSVATHTLGLYVRNQLKRFDHVMSVSVAAQTFAQNAFRINTQVVPNMVDIGMFSQDSTSPYQPGKPVDIRFLGRLVPRKGALQLIKALDYIRTNHLTTRPFKLTLGGKGPLKDQLLAYIERRDLHELITLAGFIAEEDKPSFLASADIAVFPSIGGESFGISLIEAMAASRGAVIAGDNAGYRTVMEGAEEQLVRPNDIQAFAETLVAYIEDDDRRTHAHMWQIEHVKQYDINMVVPKIVSCYEDALHKRRK